MNTRILFFVLLLAFNGCRGHCPAVQTLDVPVGIDFNVPPPVEPVNHKCLFELPSEITVDNVDQAARCLARIITDSKGVVDQQKAHLDGYAKPAT